jgi:hypothetical protein
MKSEGGTEEQSKARGAEGTGFPLYLWLFSVPLYPFAVLPGGYAGNDKHPLRSRMIEAGVV